MSVRSSWWSLAGGVLILGMQNDLAGDVTQIIEGPDKPWIYEFSVNEARQAQPALKYRLLPDRVSREPGNAAPSYYRALRQFDTYPAEVLKEFDECTRFELMTRPQAEKHEPISIDRVRANLVKFAPVISLLETAMTRDYCDWDIDFRGMDGIRTTEIPLGEFYDARKLSKLIQQKARVAIVDKNYPEACRSIQMGFQLGRDVAKCPLIIPNLVGIAISIDVQVVVMEIIAQPEAPNLYWALATLPAPLIDLSQALEEELNLALKFQILREAERDHSPDEWTRLLNESLQYLHGVRGRSAVADPNHPDDGSSAPPPERLEDFVSREAPRAQKELRILGYSPEQISEMSDIQAIATHDSMLVRHKRDNALKVMSLPYPQVVRLLNWTNDASQVLGGKQDVSQLKESIKLFETLHPSVRQALVASVRLDRLLVRSRVIEAIRMHAALNDGTFPKSLSEVNVVPIPLDPITGKEIPYRLEDETATFEFPSPVEKLPTYAEITKVTLKKKSKQQR